MFRVAVALQTKSYLVSTPRPVLVDSYSTTLSSDLYILAITP